MKTRVFDDLPSCGRRRHGPLWDACGFGRTPASEGPLPGCRSRPGFCLYFPLGFEAVNVLTPFYASRLTRRQADYDVCRQVFLAVIISSGERTLLPEPP